MEAEDQLRDEICPHLSLSVWFCPSATSLVVPYKNIGARLPRLTIRTCGATLARVAANFSSRCRTATVSAHWKSPQLMRHV